MALHSHFPHALDYTFLAAHSALLACASVVCIFTEYKHVIYHYRRQVALWVVAATAGYASTVVMIFPLVHGNLAPCEKDGHHLTHQTVVVLLLTLFALVAYWTQLVMLWLPDAWPTLAVGVVHTSFVWLVWGPHMALLCQNTSSIAVLYSSSLFVMTSTLALLYRVPDNAVQHYDDTQLKREMRWAAACGTAVLVTIYILDGIAYFAPAIVPMTLLFARAGWFSLNMLPLAYHLAWPSVRGVWLYRKRTQSSGTRNMVRYAGIGDLTATIEEDSRAMFAIEDVADEESNDGADGTTAHDVEDYIKRYTLDAATTSFLHAVDQYPEHITRETEAAHTTMLLLCVEHAPPASILHDVVHHEDAPGLTDDSEVEGPASEKTYVLAVYNSVLERLRAQIQRSLNHAHTL